MRVCLTFLLAIAVSLNAAYAVALGVCDVLGHASGHGSHIGHHQHDDEHVDLQAIGDGSGKTTLVVGHHHNHVHPSFSYMLPCTAGVFAVNQPTPIIVASASTFISTTVIPLDRPPKTIFA